MEENCFELSSNRAGNEDVKHCSSVARIVPTLNMGSGRSDLLSNCRELFSVSPKISQESNALDETRIGSNVDVLLQ